MGLNKIHYKMYKNGKKWVFAGLTTITIGGSLIIFDTHVHADEGSVVGVGKDTITNNKVTEISENKSEAVSAVSVAASNSTNSQAANVLGNKSEAVSAAPIGASNSTNSQAANVLGNKSEAVSAALIEASNSTNSQAANVLGNKSEAVSAVSVAASNSTNSQAANVLGNKSEAVSAVSVAASNSTNSQAANVLGNKSEAVSAAPIEASNSTNSQAANVLGNKSEAVSAAPIEASNSTNSQAANVLGNKSEAVSAVPVAASNSINNSGVKESDVRNNSEIKLSYRDITKKLATADQKYTNVTKDNFLDFFVLNRDASYDKDSGIVTLTQNKPNQVGNFTLKNKINVDYDFTLSGSINLGTNSHGADGIGIAFHNGKTSDVGVSGGNLGIAGLKNAVGFKLDPWYNKRAAPNPNAATESNRFGWAQDPINAPFGDFVTTSYKTPQGGNHNVWWAETEQHEGQDGYQVLDRSIYDGRFHDFSIYYTGSSHIMTIKLNQNGNDLIWEKKINVNDLNNQLAAFMMSGSTGAVTNLQQFKIKEFNYIAGQTAHVYYIDKTTGSELSADEVTGQSGSPIEYSTAKQIANYENKGYVLNSDEFIPGSMFDNDISVDQNYNVYFVHGVTPVNPDQPQEPGTPINPNDPDGPKWPTGTDAASLQAEVDQTIHYQYADGTTAAANKTDSVHFIHQIEVDKVTGAIVKDDGWQAVNSDDTFDSKESPVITGYTPNQAQSEVVSGLVHDSPNNEQTIIYTANPEKAQVTYFDDTTGQILSETDLTGQYGGTDNYRTSGQINAYEKQGYQLISDDYPTNGVVYDQDGVVKQYNVHFVHGVTPVNPDQPQEPGTPINPNRPNKLKVTKVPENLSPTESKILPHDKSPKIIAAVKDSDQLELPQTGIKDRQDNTKKKNISFLTVLSILLGLLGFGKKKNFDDRNN